MLCLGLERTLNWYKNDVDWFIAILGVALSCYMVVWIGVEEFLYKVNVGFLGEMLSIFFKTHVFFLPQLGHHSSKLIDSNFLVN